MAMGLSTSTPATVATVPTLISTGLPPPAASNEARPTATRATAVVAERCVGWGAGGRSDRALVTGTRATERAGHHAAAVAVAVTATIVAATSHHGMCQGSI